MNFVLLAVNRPFLGKMFRWETFRENVC